MLLTSVSAVFFERKSDAGLEVYRGSGRIGMGFVALAVPCQCSNHVARWQCSNQDVAAL